MAQSQPPAPPSLTLVRLIKAQPAKVFAALVEPANILRWWGPDGGPTLSAETDVRPGGRFHVVFRTLDGKEHENRGEYLEVVPMERLVFTWEWVSVTERESRVTVLLEPRDGGTELTVIHEQFFDEAVRDNHRWGWGGALDKLEALVA